jgi:catechol 2,3-dioxygenase-like lactoylglutathione lyase family enzyme
MVGFDHVDLRVRNREKLQRFFVEQMGMDVIGEGADHVYLAFGDQVLGLRDAKDGETPSGLDHIAFRVSEWTGLRNRVARARVAILREKERPDSRSLYLRGPDGLQLELVWRPDPTVHLCGHPKPPEVVPVEDDDSG